MNYLIPGFALGIIVDIHAEAMLYKLDFGIGS